MYRLVDQPLDCLSAGSRLVLWAMRAWVGAVSAGDCAPGALAPVFLRSGVIEILPQFHRVMTALTGAALEDVRIAALPHPRIVESEALILTLWADARTDPVNARSTLALMIEDEAVAATIEALIRAAARLAAAALSADGLATAAGAAS